MADFDPFANQGGPAAWDPEHADAVKMQSDEFLRRLVEEGDEPGSGPANYTDGKADGDEESEPNPSKDGDDDEKDDEQV